jgi:hypothetical protein
LTKKIDNPRSGEGFALNTKEYELLNADDVVLEKPDAFLLSSKFKEVSADGDAFGDGHVCELVYSFNEVSKTSGSDHRQLTHHILAYFFKK